MGMCCEDNDWVTKCMEYEVKGGLSNFVELIFESSFEYLEK